MRELRPSRQPYLPPLRPKGSNDVSPSSLTPQPANLTLDGLVQIPGDATMAQRWMNALNVLAKLTFQGDSTTTEELDVTEK